MMVRGDSNQGGEVPTLFDLNGQPTPAETKDAYASPTNPPSTINAGKMFIYLNKSLLFGKSKEYVTSIILHEICHTIIKAKAININFPGPPSQVAQLIEHQLLIQDKYPLKI